MALTPSVSELAMAVDEQPDEVSSLSTESSNNQEHKELFEDTPQERQIARYFETLNAAEFQAAAQLFAADGVLYPPFESRVVGPDEITRYLVKEAQGLQLFPQRKVIEELSSDLDVGSSRYTVFGAVQTSLLSVNVRWTFVLNADARISSAEVKLMADLKELLTLNRKQAPTSTL